MKRDMDLIRLLLLEIEAKHDGTGRAVNVQIDGRPRDEVTEHLFMLAEAGLIEGRDASHLQGRNFLVLRMTWNGHEFLDGVRDPQIWAETKEGAKKVGAFSLDVFSAIAKGIVKKKIADLSGVEIDF
ncbi:DUF2513 domain-containing protein [Ensifer sp. IC4062]|nr:DUF2513 domain-containing protein [Ensifer sp. IC4062]